MPADFILGPNIPFLALGIPGVVMPVKRCLSTLCVKSNERSEASEEPFDSPTSYFLLQIGGNIWALGIS
jgi:hypothetical protein